MVSPQHQDKDLSVLRIDRSEKQPERGGSGGRRSKTIAIVAIVALVIVAAALVGKHVLADTPVVRVARVAVASVPTSGETVLTASGYIVAHHTIEVSSKIVGKVAWVGIEAGDRVKKDQVLVRLDDSEYRAQRDQAAANLRSAEAKLKELEVGSRPQEIAASKATVAQAQATYDNAAINLRREQALFKQQIASQQQLTDAQSQYNVARAQWNNARQNYDLVKIGPRIEDINAQRAAVAQARAALEYAQTILDACLIRSPIDGTVLERDVEIGEMVSNENFGGTLGVKSSVASLADLNDLLVELDINENDFPKIFMHQRANVTADAYPNRVYKGYVYQISPEADRQKATIQVKVKIEHPDRYLRPEMNGHVAFFGPASRGRAQAESLTIPASALTQQNGQPAVFVLDRNRVRLENVQTGSQLDGQTEVTSGLGPNDVVVASIPASLRSGERVKAQW